jgi:hypothetical protein
MDADIVERALGGVQRGPERCVAHAVRVKSQDLRGVVARLNSDRTDTEKVAGVSASLRRVVYAQAHEFKVGLLDDHAQRVMTYSARGPLNDSIHWRLLDHTDRSTERAHSVPAVDS